MQRALPAVVVFVASCGGIYAPAAPECAVDEDCGGINVCIDGICHEIAGKGELCASLSYQDAHPCAAGLSCGHSVFIADEGFLADKFCVPVVDVGARCDREVACAPGSQCSSASNNPLTSTSGVCRPDDALRPIGDDCAGDAQCSSGKCAPIREVFQSFCVESCEVDGCPADEVCVLDPCDAEPCDVASRCAPPPCRTLTGPVVVHTLEEVAGLATACAVDGDLRVEGVAGLTSMAPLSELISVGALSIVANPDLASLEGLDLRIATSVAISDNPALTTLAGLGGLSLFDLRLERNAALVDAAAVGAVETNIFIVIGNDALRTLPLPSIGYALELDGNAGLTRLTAPRGGPVDLSGGLGLVDNPQLTDLSGLRGATNIGGFTVSNNDALTRFDGLDDVDTFGGDVTIEGNAALRSLTALGRVQTLLGQSMRVVDNPALSQCEVTGLVDRLGPPSSTVAGNAACD